MIDLKTIGETIQEKIDDMKTNPENKTDVRAELCFCKKYRSRNNKTKYIFYKGNTNIEVSEALGSFLLDNIRGLSQKEEIDELDDNLENNYIKLDDLNNIGNWKFFEEEAFNASTQKVKDLKELLNSLNCFIIYFRIEEMLIGQIRRITPSKVLSNEGFIMRLAFGNKVFNKLRDDDDVTIDKYYDFMFFLDDNEKVGVINNYDAYCSIFDFNEQFYEEAKEVVASSDIFSQFSDSDRIIKLIESDRTLQRTLRNKVCSAAFNEVKKENIKEIKDELGDSVSFDIDEEFNIKFPNDDEKKALKEFIRTVGHYYNKSIYGNHIVEGRPLRYVDTPIND